MRRHEARPRRLPTGSAPHLRAGHAIGRVRPREEFVEQKEKRRGTRGGDVEQLPDLGHLREEPRAAGLERILHARIVAPRETGVSVSDVARTTPPPARAPRSRQQRARSVLFPDILDPLTISTRGPVAPPRVTSFRTHFSEGMSGWPMPIAVMRIAPGSTTGKTSAGLSKAWLASEDSASASPTARSQRATAGPERPPRFELERITDVPHPQDRDWQEERITPRIVPVQKPAQFSDLCRGMKPTGRHRGL